MGKATAAAAVILVAAAGVVAFLFHLAAAFTLLAASANESCILPIGPAPVAAADLNDTQLAHAHTVVATGARRGESEQAIVVALATVAQESTFLNYANDGSSPNLRREQFGVAASLNYPHDAVGNDHGSVGIFQQQFPWWGTLAELMNPEVASEKFYDALGEVDGWQSMTVTQAAQAVQRSAYPDAYAQWEPLARELLSSMRGTEMTDLRPCGAAGVVADGEWTLPLAPGTYRVTSGFGMRFHPILRIHRMHTGLDFGAPGGTQVFAATSGEVTHAGWHGDGYGNLIIIQTGDVEHYYAHLQPGGVHVAAGEVVAPGQVIGAVGTTGLSTGNHLHFEIRVNGTAVDPMDFLRQQGVDPGDPP